MFDTDEYLNRSRSLYRLIEEYQNYGSLVVAYDFDNTVYDFHQKGNTYCMVIDLLKELKELGCVLICWTANEDEAFVRNYCEIKGIPLDILNDNPSFYKSESRKIYYNALLDDRAGLAQVYNELSAVVTLEKKRREIQPETII